MTGKANAAVAARTEVARRTVFVDSLLALEAARGRGLEPAARVRTAAPAMLFGAGTDAEPVDEALPPERLRALEDAALALADDLYRLFPDDPHLAVVAGRAAFADLHVLLLKAAGLRPEDFLEPVTVVRVTAGGPGFDATYASPLADLLADNPRRETIDIPHTALPIPPDSRPPNAGWRQRLAFASPATLGYRLAISLYSRIGLAGPRGTILVQRENELVKETAFALARRGFGLKLLAGDPVAPAPIPPDEAAALAAQVAPLVERRLGGLLPAPACRAVARCFDEILARHIARYRASLAAWRAELDMLSRLKPRAALANMASGPEPVALHRALGERGIPLVTVQHGVTMEIHAAMNRYHLVHENTAADLSLVFNREAARVLDANPYKRGGAVAVGLPADYRRGVAMRGLPEAPPIWYVSTALYLGNRGVLFEGVSDRDKAAHELALIQEVLDRLPHRVFYKPYPALRYLDPDPVLAAARAAQNVDLYEGREDLRYLIGSARVLVTSRGFSTPSWCLMTGRPVVFVDIPEQSALRPEAREAFDAGLFLFDAGAPDFHARLRDLLSRPLAEIEALYAEKAAARAGLIERFISTGGPGAGARGARAVEALIGGRG